jgi:hypothetical protein
MSSISRTFRAVFEALLAGAAISLAGCAGWWAGNSPLLDSLDGRGPIVLSFDNPFIAANQYLAKEMERSPELTGFIARRGGPVAIEVNRDYPMFGSPEIELYYPLTREQYHVERSGDTVLITGPTRLDPDVLGRIYAIARPPYRPPALEASHDHAAAPAAVPESTPEPLLNAEPSPAFTPSPPVPGPFVSQAGPKLPAVSPTFVPTPLPVPPSPPPPAPRNTAAASNEEIDKIIAAAPASEAEQSPQGDLVHYVTYPGETLSMISRWYTKDASNAAKIARINALKSPNRLSAGDSIVIPSYLVKNKKRLTESAVAQLAAIGRGAK